MKTSFYFIVWIAIYPILGLINYPSVNENVFLVALIAVWGLSILLNRIMPDTLAYERVSEIGPLLEDVYTGNVSAFMKRLTRKTIIETVTACYFLATTIVLFLIPYGSDANRWIALIVFSLFTVSSMFRSVGLLKARRELKDNPSAEHCAEVAEDKLKLDYQAYYAQRICMPYSEMFPPRPRFFVVYKAFSIVFAFIAILVGLYIIVDGIKCLMMMLNHSAPELGAIGEMSILYGSLCAYFGVKDLASCFSKKD